MKRVLTILAILLLPMSVWAMTPISDSDLSKVTGQAGVNINADLTMDIGLGTMAWGDADGIYGVYDVWATTAAGSGYNSGGYVGVNNFNITNLKIRARTEAGDEYNGYSTLMLKPITIDVATGTKSYIDNTGTVVSGTDITFVRFGLGALQIGMDAMQFTIALSDRDQLINNGELDELMGVVSIGAMEVYINPWSYVDIYAHAGMGVNFDVNVTLDRIDLGYVSWGDTDGMGYATTAGDTGRNWMDAALYQAPGYIGLANLYLGDDDNPGVTVTGTVQIDVVTSSSGLYLEVDAMGNALASSVSVVHISFPSDFNVSVDKITADVILGSASHLGLGTGGVFGELGDIYIQGMDLTIKDGWVDIWAH